MSLQTETVLIKRALFAIATLATLLFAATLGSALTGTSAQSPTLRMNDIQVLGTHNSYHLPPYPELLQIIKQYYPEQAQTYEYTDRPLAEQLGQLGIRQVELDVWADPGPTPLFASPIGESAIKGPSSVPIAGMTEPGLKVFHTQDFDYRSTCLTFVTCLQQIESWSAANPHHLPVLVLVEAKDDPLAVELPAGIPPAAVPLPFGAAELQSIDDEIRSVFPPAQIITPDNVRGSRATLEDAVLHDGWPTLDAARGRVLFALDNQDDRRDLYIAGHPSLQGRVMFTSSEPGTPEAAFVKLNDPVADQQRIKDLVSLGYLVRTRADADTVQARSGDTTMRDAALSSGAQFVSTDFPEPDQTFGTGYVVSIPGGKLGRCNPVLNVPGCASDIFNDTTTATPTATATATVPATSTPPTVTPTSPPPTATATVPLTATPTRTATASATASAKSVTPGPPASGDGTGPQGDALPIRTVLLFLGVVMLAIGGGIAAMRRARS